MKDVKGWAFPDRDNHFHKDVAQHPKNSYQQKTLNMALGHVKQFNVAIDVGANVGLHTARLAGKFESVYSFEPCFENFECLIKNTGMLENVTMYNFGLGSETSEHILSIPTNADNCGVNSIVDFVGKDIILDNETITVKTLDSFELEPDFIKIDTQGFELEVLKGAKQTLINNSPVIVAECTTKPEFTGVNDFLSSLGYRHADTKGKDKIWVKR